MSAIKVISLNIEGDNHLDLIIPFFKRENADVICLQEVLDKDVALMKSELKMDGTFLPLMHIKYPNSARHTLNTDWGILTLSKQKPDEISSEYYVKHSDSLPFNDPHEPNSCNRAIITTKISFANISYTIINTHFTWAPGGQSTPLQGENLDEMLKLLSTKDEFVLCGDFNAPRGLPVWQRLADTYTDNIPPTETTSIDPNLHKVKNLQLFVDGMFTTPHYTADVRVVGNVSDHKALIGIVSKI